MVRNPLLHRDIVQPPYTGDLSKGGLRSWPAFSESEWHREDLDPCSPHGRALERATCFDDLPDCSRDVRREGRSVCPSVVLLRPKLPGPWELRDHGYWSIIDDALVRLLFLSRPQTPLCGPNGAARDRRRNDIYSQVHWDIHHPHARRDFCTRPMEPSRRWNRRGQRRHGPSANHVDRGRFVDWTLLHLGDLSFSLRSATRKPQSQPRHRSIFTRADIVVQSLGDALGISAPLVAEAYIYGLADTDFGRFARVISLDTSLTGHHAGITRQPSPSSPLSHS